MRVVHFYTVGPQRPTLRLVRNPKWDPANDPLPSGWYQCPECCGDGMDYEDADRVCSCCAGGGQIPPEAA